MRPYLTERICLEAMLLPLGQDLARHDPIFFAERFASFRTSLEVSLAAEPLQPRDLLKYILKSTCTLDKMGTYAQVLVAYLTI